MQQDLQLPHTSCDIDLDTIDRSLIFLQASQTEFTTSKKKVSKAKKSGHHECQLCSKTFTRAIGLKYHILVHAGQEPFKCDYCGKKFTERGNYNKHMETHTTEKSHICPVCGKGFKLLSYPLDVRMESIFY